MKSKQNSKNSKKTTKKSKKVSSSEGDVKTEKSCDTCHFSTLGVLNENMYCKRHREYRRTLFRMGIVTEDNPVCKLWHVSLR